MSRYNVTYFYLATGMEGRADQRDYGEVEANSSREAERIVAERISPKHADWMMGCLTAKEILPEGDVVVTI